MKNLGASFNGRLCSCSSARFQQMIQRIKFRCKYEIIKYLDIYELNRRELFRQEKGKK